MCFIMYFSGLKWLRKIWLRKGGSVIFLALLKIEWFSQMLGLDSNMLCFLRSFFFWHQSNVRWVQEGDP